MSVALVRIGFAAAAVAASAVVAGPAPQASANVGGIAVMYTGSEGPVMGCPHEVGVGLWDPVLSDTTISVDGVALGPLHPYPYSGVWAVWTPDRLGWHTIEVVQSQPGMPTSVGRLDIEVRRVGINAGSSCIANGFPLPIDPNTGALAQFR